MLRVITVCSFVVVTLAACGGGGGNGPVLTPSELEQTRSDPRVVRAAGIIERANTLNIPAAYFDLTATAQGQTEHFRLPMSGSCYRTRCTLVGGGESATFTLADLLSPSPDSDVSRIVLGRRAGMDTALVEGRSRLSENVYGDSLTANLSAKSYGVWGEYGFASVGTVRGPFSGSLQGVRVTGNLDAALAYVLGRPIGSNPTGLGSATWTGAAEAVSTRNYQHRSGTATITMADLSIPRVAVDIDITGYSIGSPAWNNIPIYKGRFVTGTNGYDRLIGDFYGSRHQESYGTFDTGAYVGAFGAKRTY